MTFVTEDIEEQFKAVEAEVGRSFLYLTDTRYKKEIDDLYSRKQLEKIRTILPLFCHVIEELIAGNGEISSCFSVAYQDNSHFLGPEAFEAKIKLGNPKLYDKYMYFEIKMEKETVSIERKGAATYDGKTREYIRGGRAEVDQNVTKALLIYAYHNQLISIPHRGPPLADETPVSEPYARYVSHDDCRS